MILHSPRILIRIGDDPPRSEHDRDAGSGDPSHVLAERIDDRFIRYRGVLSELSFRETRLREKTLLGAAHVELPRHVRGIHRRGKSEERQYDDMKRIELREEAFPGHLLLLEPVSDAVHGLEMPPEGTELLAEPHDVHVDGTVRDGVVLAASPIDDLLPREDPTGSPREEMEDSELGRGEVDPFASDGDLMAPRMYHEILKLDDGPGLRPAPSSFSGARP